ncbi:MAG: ATP-binding cassette domain-containing protein [Candidatus Nanopelagicales bacterium]
MTAETTAVRCDRLVKLYWAATGEVQALRGVEAVFRTGTMSAITGPSGSGKSSLLSILALNERHTAGDLEVFGASVSGLSTRAVARLRRRTISWVPQRASDALLPSLRVDEQLAQVANLRGRSVPDAALERLQLEHRRRARVHELSGGEQQRLAVLAAVTSGARLVVADEPTAQLDDESAALVIAELRACADAGSCVVVASHDDRIVPMTDRVLALRHGVLSAEHAEGRSLVPIDSAGRLQLPPAALRMFPDDRAELVIEDDRVVLRRPAELEDGP